jgi:hypothetical protein
MGDGAFHVAQNYRSHAWLVSQQMQMIRHNHVSEKQEAARLPSLINRSTSDEFDRVGLKNRQPIFGDNREIRARRISGDFESLWFHRQVGAQPRR